MHHALNGIKLHTMTASNVFARNQTVDFERDGISIPVTKSSGTPELLVAPLSVMSTDNDAYQAGAQAGINAAVGRYELRNQHHIFPRQPLRWNAPHRGKRPVVADERATGNRVGPGDIAGFANAASLMGVRVAPLTAASGGSDGEEVANEERRFADALLTRGRIVTRQDLETAALAIDRRIVRAKSRSGVVRRDGALRRVEAVELLLDAGGFTDAHIELSALKSQIELSFQSRLVQGLELSVEFAWSE